MTSVPEYQRNSICAHLPWYVTVPHCPVCVIMINVQSDQCQTGRSGHHENHFIYASSRWSLKPMGTPESRGLKRGATPPNEPPQPPSWIFMGQWGLQLGEKIRNLSSRRLSRGTSRGSGTPVKFWGNTGDMWSVDAAPNTVLGDQRCELSTHNPQLKSTDTRLVSSRTTL